MPARTLGGARRYSAAELVNLKKEIRPFITRQKGLVSIATAAKALRVSPDTIRNWDRKGLIDASRSKGGARRFTRSEIERLQKELGVEGVGIPQEAKVLTEIPKAIHEVPNLSPAWMKITFSTVLIVLILVSGGIFVSYIEPLNKKVDEISKLVVEMVRSIETLQKGVLGIQAQSEPSPIPLPVNLTTNLASSNSNSSVITSAEVPITLDTSSGKIGCAACLTAASSYLSTITNADGTLSISLDDKTANLSLDLGHTNNWSATQAFSGGIGVGTLSPSQLFQLNPSTSNPVVMTSGGNVGIGITSPVNKLEVSGAQTIGSEYAGVYTAPANGLIVQGNVGIGNSAPSYHLDVGGGARFSCTVSNWTDGPATTCSDVAEIYESDGSIDVGDIVTVGSGGTVTKSINPYQNNIIGVYSTSPALLVGGQTILGGSGNLGDHKIPVALAGRVPVKVSDENGPISTGDYLTSSSIPGVAMKATRAGPVVGQAFEPFNPGEGVEADALEDTQHLVDIKARFGKILVFVKVSYADPGNFFASLATDDQGNLIVPKITTGSITLDPDLASAEAYLPGEGQATSSRHLPGTASVNANTTYYDLSGKIASLEERIKALEDADASKNVILASDQNPVATDSGVVNSDNVAVASVSASLARAITSASATSEVNSSSQPDHTSEVNIIAANCTLYPENCNLNLVPPETLLASSSATLANIKATDTLSSDKLFTAQDSRISGDLNVFGKTVLSATTIAGDLTVDGTLSINGNSINVIGSGNCSDTKATCGILYLQSSQLAYQVDFFNSLVTIDKLGNLKAQTVIVAEFKVVANKISGSSKIGVGDKSVDIENPLVKPTSRILITPTSETDTVLAVTDKAEGKKFTVSTAKPAAKDIIFDWFLINEVN